MTFNQFRIVAFIFMFSAILATVILSPFSVGLLVAAVVSTGGAAWIAYWLPLALTDIQKRLGL